MNLMSGSALFTPLGGRSSDQSVGLICEWSGLCIGPGRQNYHLCFYARARDPLLSKRGRGENVICTTREHHCHLRGFQFQCPGAALTHHTHGARKFSSPAIELRTNGLRKQWSGATSNHIAIGVMGKHLLKREGRPRPPKQTLAPRLGKGSSSK